MLCVMRSVTTLSSAYLSIAASMTMVVVPPPLLRDGRTRYPHPISVLPWRVRSTIPFLLTCAYTPKLDDVMLFLVQQNRPPEDDEDEDGFIKTDPEDMFHVHHGHRVQHKPSAFNAKPKLMHSEVRAQKPAKKGSAFRCVRNASHARKRNVINIKRTPSFCSPNQCTCGFPDTYNFRYFL